MDKFKLIDEKREQLKEIEKIIPWVFEDGILNIKKFEEEFSVFSNNDYINSTERYGLYWYGKTLAKNYANTPSLNSLIPNKNESLNFDDSNNVIISGDNLEVLKLLKFSYAKKVDIIYIDPPYNTGNDFIYNDDFSQSVKEYNLQNEIFDDENNRLRTNPKTSGRFHTKWLDMMYPRLLLSWQLLKDDGLIFISIDDNEYAKLKMLCDEIFGENNFVSTIIWRKKNTGGGSSATKIEIETEYVLIFQKKFNMNVFKGKSIESSNYSLRDKYYSERGGYNITDLDRVCSASSFKYLESLDYEIEGPDGTLFKNYRNILKPKSYCYTISKPLFEFMNKNGFIVMKEVNGHWKAYRKSYEKVVINQKDFKIVPRTYGGSFNNIVDNEIVNKVIPEGINSETFNSIIDQGNITTSNGKRDLIKLTDNKDFSFPKPVKLIEYLINLCKNKDALVLDFFAGSGTTGHAVMALNNKDGGNRKYILVQIKEVIDNSDFDSIVDITKTRINNVISAYNYKDKGFKYFELAPSNFKNLTNKTIDIEDKENIRLNILNQSKSIKEDINNLDLVYEVGLKHNIFTLDQNVESHYKNGQKYYLVDNKNTSTFFFFDPFKETNYYYNVEDNIINFIKESMNNKSIRVYLLDHLFESDQQKIELDLRLKDLSDQISVVVI